jgi:hypothetical protein
VGVDRLERDEILQRARAAVEERGRQYGDCFDNVATLWNAWLKVRNRRGGGDLGGVDVAVMLGLMKVGRIANGGNHVDSFIDWCGYGSCAGELATKGEGNE